MAEPDLGSHTHYIATTGGEEDWPPDGCRVFHTREEAGKWIEDTESPSLVEMERLNINDYTDVGLWRWAQIVVDPPGKVPE